MKVNDNLLLAEFRAERCELCGADGPNDPHHLWPKGMGGGKQLDVRWNLVTLCRMCHTLAEAGQPHRDRLCGLAIQREVWRLLRMPKGTEWIRSL